MVGQRVRIRCLDANSIELMRQFVGKIGTVSDIRGDHYYIKLREAKGFNQGNDYFWHRSSLINMDTKLAKILYK